jgi:hypothetical protein
VGWSLHLLKQRKKTRKKRGRRKEEEEQGHEEGNGTARGEMEAARAEMEEGI